MSFKVKQLLRYQANHKNFWEYILNLFFFANLLTILLLSTGSMTGSNSLSSSSIFILLNAVSVYLFVSVWFQQSTCRSPLYLYSTLKLRNINLSKILNNVDTIQRADERVGGSTQACPSNLPFAGYCQAQSINPQAIPWEIKKKNRSRSDTIKPSIINQCI